MKQTPLVIFFCLAIQICFAQVVIEENPSYINSSEKPLLDTILKVDVLNGTTLPVEISPSAQKLCFDKVFKITTTTPKGESSVCLFINTKIGLMAYTPMKPGSNPGVCDIKPAAPDFSLNVISLKGNIYTYMNVKKPTGIERWFMTGNSNTYLYQFANTETGQSLYKKDLSREFLNGKVKAWAYQSDTRPEKWFLFGKMLPDSIIMQPLKYVGNFGVGYQHTDKGTFIIMQVEGENLNSVVKEITDTYICFDPSPYKKYEDQVFDKEMEAIAREKRKLDRDEAAAASSVCVAQELKKIHFEREALQRREQAARKSTEQNIYQNTTTQKARADATINYNDQVQIIIYDLEAQICRINNQLSNSDPGSSSHQRMVERRGCLNKSLQMQYEALGEMQRIDRQYINKPGEGFAQKSFVFMRYLKSCN